MIRRYLRWLKLLYGRPRALPPRDLPRVDPEPIAINWDAMRRR
jgi:hypothetical protein